jgi:serine/threonine-protein kinase
MQQGDLIAGKYRIDRILGQGGMGTVVAATNLLIDQPVALKFLLPELASDAAVVERLLREARASARLRSEHVCLVYDVGNDNGAPFIVMELLDGRDLASMVSTRTVLPVSIATDYILQAAVGLAEAHALGIVHRDLKPANLFLTRRLDGTPLIKVLDFGIAKAPSDTQFHLTRTAAVMGSPGYMSPEQLRSTRDADARSDIWALGVILFELTAGRPPFVAESITELTLRVAVDPTPRLPGVPPEFERVVARCLEKDPSRRFGDVGQLAAALAPFGTARAAETAAGIVSMLRASTVAPSPPAVLADATPTTLGSSASSLPSPTVRRSRLPWGVAAGGALVAAGVLVVTAMGGGSRAPALPSVHVDAPVPRAPVVSSPATGGDTAAASNPAVGTAAVPAPALQPIASVPSTAAGSPPDTKPPAVVTSSPPAVQAQPARSSPPSSPAANPSEDSTSLHGSVAKGRPGVESSPAPLAKPRPAAVASPPPVVKAQSTTASTSAPAAKGQADPEPSGPPAAKGQPTSGRSQAPVAHAGTPVTPSPTHKPQRNPVDTPAQPAPKPKPPAARDIGASRE